MYFAVMLQFTAAEIALYEKRLEEGFDLKTDDRYNAWLKLQDIAGTCLYMQRMHNMHCYNYLNILALWFRFDYCI